MISCFDQPGGKEDNDENLDYGNAYNDHNVIIDEVDIMVMIMAMTIMTITSEHDKLQW